MLESSHVTIVNRVTESEENALTEQTHAQLTNLREMLDIVLRRAVYTVGGGFSLSNGLRESMRRVCVIAHARGVQIEQLLVMVKDAWFELPEPRRILQDHSTDVLSRVVTLCIDQYYALKDEDQTS